MNEREKFEKWAVVWELDLTMFSDSPVTYIKRETQVAYEAWQAALSTRKAYGYGIVDKDGKNDFVLFPEYPHSWLGSMDQDYPGHGYRVVELFYEDSES